MEKIPYAPIELSKPPQSRTGKVPYLLRTDNTILADSNLIIDTLALEHGIDLSYGARPEEQASLHLALRTLEESLYFAAVWERWQDPDYWPATKEAMFGHLPVGVRHLLAAVVRRKMLASLHGQGIGRLLPDVIAAVGAADIRALATLLGEKPYFHGDKPGVTDASAYGIFANLFAFPKQTPLQREADKHANLRAFCQRMKFHYWKA
jgi:glutathione S-transferase